MPDLIRHPVPEQSEKNTGFRVKPGMTKKAFLAFYGLVTVYQQ
jgi:hypothetical protein